MYESSKRQPKTAEDYAKIAKYFGVSLDYFWGLSDSPNTISEITVCDMKSIEKDLNRMMEDIENNPDQGFAAYNDEDINETAIELFKNALRDALILAKKINKKKYITNNPYNLANYLGINIIKRLLGKIKGCYELIKCNKFIFLNSDFDDELTVVCSHELGHAIMHPYTNCKFIKNCTLFLINKIEIEANTFAAHLLIPDITIYENFTYEQISKATNIPTEIVKLRQS